MSTVTTLENLGQIQGLGGFSGSWKGRIGTVENEVESSLIFKKTSEGTGSVQCRSSVLKESTLRWRAVRVPIASSLEAGENIAIFDVRKLI